MLKAMKIAAWSAAVGAFLAVAPMAMAQNSNCGPASAAQALVDEFKEIPIISWMSDKGEVIMVYANIDTGTVTAFASRGNNYCIVSSGRNAQIGMPKKGPPGKDEL